MCAKAPQTAYTVRTFSESLPSQLSIANHQNLVVQVSSPYDISDILCFKLAVRDLYRFKRHEERKVDFKEDTELQGRASKGHFQRSSVRESVMLYSCKNWEQILYHFDQFSSNM